MKKSATYSTTLIGRLLRQHVSPLQLAGFALANLCGMLIVVLAFQFYRDTAAIFSGEDNFLHANYLVVNKRIGTGTTLSGRTPTFDAEEIDDMRSQPFISEVGFFTNTTYDVHAQLGINGQQLLSSELYFESVPDAYIDIDTQAWTYRPGTDSVPIILPRVYINMYNFGFAHNKSLPKISEGVLSMIDVAIRIDGRQGQQRFAGKVVGFSKRLHTILVPQAFMDWSNATFGTKDPQPPSRVILKVDNPTDERLATYLEDNQYEEETDNLDAEKTSYFLRVVLTLVIIVGLLIAAMSFYMLLLSIYLLVQKNAEKLRNLLLIGYPPAIVARPYQRLAIVLNVAVLIIAILAVALIRPRYMDIITALFPNLDDGSLWPAIIIGGIICAVVCMLNVVVIRRKISQVWNEGRVKKE